MDDPRFASASARKLNFGALHQIIQTWILTFSDMATLDAQFDEAKIAMGQIRSIKDLAASEWSDYWGAVQHVPDRSGGEYRLPGRPWHFSNEQLSPAGAPAFQGEHNVELLAERNVDPALIENLRQLSAQAGALADAMDFGFLLDPHRKLMSVGFDAETQQLQHSCYDLLATESRAAVFIAIAKEDIPQDCWFRLGRGHTLDHGRPVLLSWTGTMFEYLMPSL